ncbi:MAG: hypothetical protein ABI885_18550 [Gammaproteobacteria bacterium]
MGDADPDVVRRHLQRLLASDQLAKSETSRKLLTYLVERSIGNDIPKETEIALDMFGKDATFSSAEDSVVRVGVRTLRQKLAEYYASAGHLDELRLGIPKGGYRVVVQPRADLSAAPPVVPAATTELGMEDAATLAATTSPVISARSPKALRRAMWGWAAGAALALFAVSLIVNVYLWSHRVTTESDPELASVRSSRVWADMVASPRPLTIVLGDLFMFTQIDPRTGRTQTVRDATINSSEELRAYLANNPSFASERGQRYATMIQKSAAVGMVSILRIVDHTSRRVEVLARDDLQADAVRSNDIIYLGPLGRLGPLAGYYQLGSRYRFRTEDSRVTDTLSQKVFLPEGELGDQHRDYALAASFKGPTGNRIMIFTSGARNAGLLQIVRTLTSREGLARFDAASRAKLGAVPESFEALLTVTGFKQTDLNAEVVDINALPAKAVSARKPPVVAPN